MEAIHRVLGLPPTERERRGAVEHKIATVRALLEELALARDPDLPVILLMLALNECRAAGAKPAGIVYGLGLIYGMPIEATFGDEWMAPTKGAQAAQANPGQPLPPPQPGWQALDQDTLVEQLLQETVAWWGQIPPEQTLLSEINYGQLRKAFNRVLDAPPSNLPGGPAQAGPGPGTGTPGIH